MDGKEFYKKTEEFAKKIINLSTEEGLTVRELWCAADIAKDIANNSSVEREAIVKTDFPSTHIVETCNGKGLFGD